jgi:hypothetical protein
MLDQVAFLPDGTRVAVEHGVQDTLRLLKHGDGILGWEGDPNMEIMVDLITGMYDVWTLDTQGRPYLAFSRPYCDHRLVQDALACDTRRRDVAGDVMKLNLAREAAAQATFEDQVEEYADKLHFALRKDLGHLFGGTRRQTSMSGARP